MGIISSSPPSPVALKQLLYRLLRAKRGYTAATLARFSEKIQGVPIG